MTWSRALNTVRENMLVIVAMPRWMLSLPLLPAIWTNADLAMKELGQYMEDRLVNNLGSAGSGNLLSSLVRSSEQAKKSNIEPSLEPQSLSRADILGDIFAFSLAGHETTGNVLTFAIYLLAVHPEVQAWVQEEIDLVHAREESMDYKIFPGLNRCLAIMLETLRLFPSVIAVPKHTRKEQRLIVNSREHTIPSGTTIILNIMAIHTHPGYWGEDSLTWRPSRWIEPEYSLDQLGGDKERAANPKGERLWKPRPGTFFPWSGGPRDCPGMRYSKVEFVAVLGTLLRQHRVEPRKLAGESEHESYRRVMSALGDCKFAMTLYMANPKSVAMCWSAR
ncbi:MAG: hypothetical protein Q9210_002875 [Variospora velana]